jgi:5-(carboxyamino)imidazole ribonucleotide synthase
LAQLLAGLCDAITTEFENGAGQCAASLAVIGHTSAAAVAITQDGFRKKSHFMASAGAADVRCAPYAVIETLPGYSSGRVTTCCPAFENRAHGLRRQGQMRVRNAAELAVALGRTGNQVACVLEKMPLKAECSVIVARGWDSAIVAFPPQ